MTTRMTVDPEALPQADPEAPACPTTPRAAPLTFQPLTEEEEAARRATLPEAARRALAEADARRAAGTPDRPVELGGRDGPEPVRFGDWERKGIAVDF
ncbi:DUF1674 domain-containing protein [Jannaschia sp. M317]|uniref:DUF1674 domain-containing protein n=1 Tax=Jannaschia sp. M317 TaxID=2867011 RepID=UPI0021A64D3C|nr:DUF1674 domain-containing protein [Jannaschia sp. M317]